jgi:hypothetical protein
MPEAIRLGDLVLQGLAVNRNVLVHDDQIDGQPLHAPVGVRLDQLLTISIFSGSLIRSRTIGASPEMP